MNMFAADSGAEKRKFFRFGTLGRLPEGVTVQANRRQLECWPCDISSGGIGLWTREPVPAGSVVEISLPEPVQSQQKIVFVVRWTKTNFANSSMSRSGLELTTDGVDLINLLSKLHIQIIPDHSMKHDGSGKATKEQIIEALSSLQVKQPAHSDLVRDLIHDIVSPLSVVQLRAEQLKTYLSDLVANEEQIRRTSEKIFTRTQQVIEFVRSVSASLSTNTTVFERYSLKKLISTVIEWTGDHAEANSVDFEVIMPPAPIELLCKPQELKRALSNLINNAIDALSHGRGKRLITITCRREADQLLIDVSNNGAKIPDDVAERIFSERISTKSSGSGIGTQMAKKFIENNGGKILLLRDTKDTTFRITLPMR